MKRCLGCDARFDAPGWTCQECGYAPVHRCGYPAFAPRLAEANDGFAPGYFEKLAELEAGSFWFRSRNRLLMWALRRYFPRSQSLLEVGCGTGFVLMACRQAFPELTLVGSDVYSEGFAFAERRVPGAQLAQMDACRLPFYDEFDVIGAFDVIEHIEDDTLALTEMFRAVKPGGGLMVTVPQHPALWSVRDEYAFHKRRYRRDSLRNAVKRAGFRPIYATSFVSFLLPLMLLSRLRARWAPADYDPHVEYPSNPSLNAALEKVMDLEVAAIQRGLSLPLGGSLLMVAIREP